MFCRQQPTNQKFSFLSFHQSTCFEVAVAADEEVVDHQLVVVDLEEDLLEEVEEEEEMVDEVEVKVEDVAAETVDEGECDSIFVLCCWH